MSLIGYLMVAPAQPVRTIDPIVLAITAFIVGFLIGVLATLAVSQIQFSQKNLVNAVAIAILLIWTSSVIGEMRYVDYRTPFYIHLIAGMAAGSILEVQNAVNAFGNRRRQQ